MTKEEFIDLYTLNVNDKVEKKNKLKYLSWSYARAEFKKKFPNATYEIKMFDNKPYICDEDLWYMVFTSVTVWDLTHEMWLPVMDWANRAMKDREYKYKVKDFTTWEYVEKTVQPATMFDVNKTIMRCLTKNLAMFGLGLYIYNWEDLPDEEKETTTKDDDKPRITEEQVLSMKNKTDWIKWFPTKEELLKKIREKYKVSKDNAKAIENIYFLITGQNEWTNWTDDTKAWELQTEVTNAN